MVEGPKYSQRARREYIDQMLERRYGWRNYEKLTGGSSYNQIAWDVKQHFGRDKPLTAAAIKKDVDWLRERATLPTDEELSEGQRLLLPENFPEWRSKMFTDPATGLPYDTPVHQMAWFWMTYSLAVKKAVPAWVLAYLEIDADFNDALLSGDHLVSAILLAPPRHGKTELAIHALIWLICAFPNIRVIYCSGILNTSQDNLDLVRAELEENELLNAYYGPFKGETNRWNRSGFIVMTREIRAKSMTGLPIGKGSNVLSKDADLIFVDDPQDLDAAESEIQTDRDEKWLTTQVMTRREPHTAFLGWGSHLPSESGDMWSRVEEKAADLGQGRHKLVISKLKAHDYEKCDPENDPDHVNCVLWHKLRPYWFLEAQRGALGDMLYEAVFNQNPRDSKVDYFRPEVVRSEYIHVSVEEGKRKRELPDLTQRDAGILDIRRSWKSTDINCCSLPLLIALGFDPAASERKSASESALAILGGCPMCGRRYVIDYWHARQSPELHADTILGYARAFAPRRVRIESNAFQKALSRDDKLTKGARTHGYLIDEWNTDERKWDPVLGIPMVNRHLEAGQFSVPYANKADQAYAEDLLKALIRWPKKPNDIPMAIWLADMSVEAMIEEYNYITPDVMPGWDNMPEYLKEQMNEVDLGELFALGISGAV